MQDPTVAIALRYAPKEGEAAPSIVAKGDGFLAQEILRVARDHDVPLRQDPALAGALATLDVGRQVPAELFRAVAEVLAFVYKMNGKT
jgi:flagellar biosynthesis protein